MKKKRLIICDGYYSIVNTIVVLKQQEKGEDFENILILWINSQDIKSLSDFAESFNIFDSIHIVFLKDKGDGFIKASKILPYKFYDEIISPYTWVYTKRLSKYGIDCNALIIVDEGIETYVDIDRLYYSSLPKKLHSIYLLNTELVSKLHNGEYLKKIKLIDMDIYYKVLSTIKEDLILKDNSVIFLSSSSWQSSQKIGYDNNDIAIIQLLISLGYNVYYKHTLEIT
ncbi:MAG: hypothetical protein FWE18_01715 [Alphaproteobacteria bacterium]|nr:hypothetical protein [Alphaproteobacteria bacterium]